ncbi:MAG TPA: C40 family peptidase [Ramlibacter sp.]|nr:C40 family peptidase [Ramlibacter sp.]
MNRWLIVCSLLLACAVAQAAPDQSRDDELGNFIATSQVLNTLGHVGHTVSDRASALVANAGDRASELVVNAMGFLGVPYRRGGNSAETGFDCSGFVRAMYQSTVGLILPRRAKEQAAATEKIEKKDLQPGDLVFFNTMRRAFSHVGIYIGDGKFIHSPRPGAEVRVEDMGVAYWKRRFDGARRVLAQQPRD